MCDNTPKGLSRRLPGVAWLLAAASAAMLTACSTAPVDGLEWVTYPAQDEAGGDAAQLPGTIGSEDGCLVLVAEDGTRTVPVFASNDERPAGFSIGDDVELGGGGGGSIADLGDEYTVPEVCEGLDLTVVHVAQPE